MLRFANTILLIAPTSIQSESWGNIKNSLAR